MSGEGWQAIYYNCILLIHVQKNNVYHKHAPPTERFLTKLLVSEAVPQFYGDN